MTAQTKLSKLTRQDIAYAFNVDVRTVSRWRQQGMPCNPGPGSTYDLPACVRWRLARIEEALPPTLGTESEESQKALTAWRRERYKIARIERLALEGKYVLKSDVEKESFECARSTRDQLMSVPDRLDSVLAAEGDPHQVGRLLSTEIRSALNGAMVIIKERLGSDGNL